jgi:hypothetical protein
MKAQKKDKFSFMKIMPTDYDQKIQLSELKNLSYIVASAVIKEYGFYTCMIGDKKTLVIN